MQREHIKVLLVEDSPADARLVQEMLADSVNCTFDFNHAENIATTNSYLDKYHFDVLLLDLSLPDSNGLESLESMVSINPDLPIVVLTCLNDEQMAINAVQYGAQDYLIKGQGGAALLTRALRYAIERKRSEQRLSYLAQYDALTNLPNRALFWDRLKQAIKHASRTNKKGALMFLDLDLFKNINDTLGHTAGDKLLAVLAIRLKKCIREVDTVARLGGDEFTIILNEVDNKIDATLVAKKITQVIKQPITIDNQEVFISTSIGITLFSNNNDLPDTLIKHADMALYAAKEKGRGSYLYYEDKMDKRVTKRINMINDLRFALDRNEFRLHYQPQIDLASGKLIGMEALIRWQHPKRGLLPPAKFVHLLEETGLIVKVGDWVLAEACKQTNLWHEKKLGRLRIAVNLSSRQFHEKNLLKCIKKALSDSQLPPGYLQIEVTESTLMTNSRESIVILRELRELGIQLSIDDFGTGFSSLSYLRLFSFQALKIDQSFVKEISTHSDVEKIITAVISLAHSLDMKVVAEGVELEQQLPFLVQNGCDEVQGYLFSKPMSADDCSVWLKNNNTNKVTFISTPAVELKNKNKNKNKKHN